ncbi:TetR family transcriptional regulator [Aeromicrobium sp.]|uniref:TetR/AcrR family transcriptional regulator n=1 Tax=Aeromicrobium sp. TaxID=1871063 RepID=UPI0025B817F8|nr:TetR family transcriptional regulator [Aeromicrobium sp.]MCK5892291.1 TetR family transcriptional regulator [Aeromicrobium sp.]
MSRAQLSQVRSRARREALLAAAIELFAEGGARAVTHRAVAARAGLPPATTTYYFASIDELVREALATHLAGWIEVLEALADIDLDPSIDLASTSDFVQSVFATRSPEKAGIELAIYLAAARDPELTATAAEALQALEDLALRTLERLGIAGAHDLAPQVVALIAGSALRRQSAQYDDAEEARLLTLAIRHLVTSHVSATGTESLS